MNAADYNEGYKDARDEYAPRLARAEAALETLRAAWNAHMETCPQHAALPDLPAPSMEQIAEWANAPSDTASASGLSS